MAEHFELRVAYRAKNHPVLIQFFDAGTLDLMLFVLIAELTLYSLITEIACMALFP